VPDFFFGQTKKDAVYLLCSDGFRHVVSPLELYQAFAPQLMQSAEIMKQREVEIIELNKARQETDNISVITIRTF